MANHIEEGYSALQKAIQELDENRDYVAEDVMSQLLGRITK
jgi:hypothetical protein